MDKPAADIDQCLRSVKRRFPEVNPLVLQVLQLVFVGVGVFVWGGVCVGCVGGDVCVWGVCGVSVSGGVWGGVCVGVYMCMCLYVCVCLSVCVCDLVGDCMSTCEQVCLCACVCFIHRWRCTVYYYIFWITLHIIELYIRSYLNCC